MSTFSDRTIARIAAASHTLTPFVQDWRRQLAEAGGERGEYAPGIADDMRRAYCFAVTGFANWRKRSESDAWVFLAAEARKALHVCDESDADSRQWVLTHVHALERAAAIAATVKDGATACP